GWVMSLEAIHVQDSPVGEKILDIIVSDRKGPGRGVYWLDRHRVGGDWAWSQHAIGGEDREVMFMAIGRRHRGLTIFTATRHGEILAFERIPRFVGGIGKPPS